MSDTRTKVRALIDEIAPQLGLHGGSIELVRITPDNVVELRFQGACVGCVAADMTLEYGIKELLMLKIPELDDVIAVNTEPATHAIPEILRNA